MSGMDVMIKSLLRAVGFNSEEFIGQANKFVGDVSAQVISFDRRISEMETRLDEINARISEIHAVIVQRKPILAIASTKEDDANAA